MDRKPSEKAEIERLIRLSESARTRLGMEAARIRRQFDIPSRIRTSLGSHPLSWLFGSLASGLAASLFFRRRKSVVKPGRRGLAGAVFGIALTAARPLLKVWLSNLTGRWLEQAAIPRAAQPVRRSSRTSEFP